MPDRILPTLIRLLAIILVVLGDERIDAGQRELLLGGSRNRLDDQLCVAVRRLLQIVGAAARVAAVAGVVARRDGACCGRHLEQILLRQISQRKSRVRGKNYVATWEVN